MHWLSRPAYLIFSTEVSSTFLPKHTTQSIHKVANIGREVTSSLGISVTLSDWLPAIPDKQVSITIKLIAVRDEPFGKLTSKIGDLGLGSALSLLAPQIGEGLKIAGIVGQILSTVLEEGKQDQILTLTADLPIATLRSGYLATLSPATPNDVPTKLELRPGGQLGDPSAPFSERNTYAILRVSAEPRRGIEAARATAWWITLQDGLRQVRRLSPPKNDRDRRKANGIWLDTMDRAERLSEEDRSFLLSESKEIIQEQAQEAYRLIQPRTSTETLRSDEFSEEEQRILGVRSMQELDVAVTNYRAKLAHSAAVRPPEQPAHLAAADSTEQLP
jgi:hypothetical protein